MSLSAGKLLAFLIILAIGIGLLLLIRRRMSDRSPVMATAASIALLVATFLIAAPSVGLVVTLAFTPAVLVVSSFLGAIMSQSSPWAPPSILRGLAISSGCIALVSVLAANYLVAVLALLATGVLVVLYSNLAPTHSSRAHERSSAGAA